MSRLAHVTLVVRDQDEAVAWFRDKLGFRLIEDTPVPEQDKRWVLMEPSSGGTQLLLARAATPGQEPRVGDQTGGRVAFFLHTDDFRRDHRAFQERGVVFVREPREESYGTVAVFEDLCGNLWDLVQPTDA